MIQLIPIMKIIFNTCNTMFYILNFVYFASISNRGLFIFLIIFKFFLFCIYFSLQVIQRWRATVRGPWPRFTRDHALQRRVGRRRRRGRTGGGGGEAAAAGGSRLLPRRRTSGRRTRRSRCGRRMMRSRFGTQTRTTTRRRPPRVLLPLVRRASTCEVPRASLTLLRFLTDAQ